MVCPGAHRTPMLEGVFSRTSPGEPEKAEAMYRSRIPMGRLGAPEKAARAILWLLSAEAAYVNGGILQGTRSRQRGTSVVSASTMFAVTLAELRSGIETGTVPLADRERAERASMRLDIAPGALPGLMRQLRALVAQAQADEVSEGGEPVRLSVALFPAGAAPPTKAPPASRGRSHRRRR